ncbi:RHS repeat domain-containing protein [Ottowia testudinis]|uniref:RHS domain-containing protein n=1 Tax=Ottowia testudinis TaxID=2816950 RepID=A0A975CHB0_9BURK|nr:RHS repeat-associated core domain-containing protein [Ottowia testudinis]QTD46385.1 RHS domain-containing protein [Ottowia testudinis]
MAEANDQGQITKAYGFNPNTQAEELDLWSTDPIWQAELNGKTNLSEASYHYIATDHLGTPMLATNQQGAKTWRSYQEAFGQTYTDSAGLELNLRFPGQYWDKETNLHQNYFRDYSPQKGRYIQADPIGLDGEINVYEYAYHSPVIYYDPYGLFGMDNVWGGFYWVTGGWVPTQGQVNFAAGFGDALTFNTTKKYRKILGWNGGVDECSPMYMFGGFAAAALPGGYAINASRYVKPAFNIFSKKFWRYELGQKTIPDALYGRIVSKGGGAEERAGLILKELGWLTSIFSLKGNWRATVPTGPTPGLVGFSYIMSGAMLTKTAVGACSCR